MRVNSLILEFTGVDCEVIRKSRWEQLIRISVDSGVSDFPQFILGSEFNLIDDHYDEFQYVLDN